MSNPRVIRGGHRAKAEAQSTGKKKWIVLAALFLLLSSLGAWAMLPRTDPQLEKVRELRTQIEAAPEGQRRELWGQMREAMEQLPEATREQLFAERRQEWEERENKHLDEFFSKSKTEQLAMIDEDINRDEARRVEREKRRAERERAQASGQGGGRGDRGNGGRGNWGGRGGGGSACTRRAAPPPGPRR